MVSKATQESVFHQLKNKKHFVNYSSAAESFYITVFESSSCCRTRSQSIDDCIRHDEPDSGITLTRRANLAPARSSRPDRKSRTGGTLWDGKGIPDHVHCCINRRLHSDDLNLQAHQEHNGPSRMLFPPQRYCDFSHDSIGRKKLLANLHYVRKCDFYYSWKAK